MRAGLARPLSAHVRVARVFCMPISGTLAVRQLSVLATHSNPVGSPLLSFGGLRRGRMTFQPSASRAMSSLPSHNLLQMPALSPTMTAGNIAKWMVKEGQKINPGDHICDIETDKATIAWEAQDEGYIAKLLVGDSTNDVPVGKVVIVMCDEEADVAAFVNYTPPTEAAPAGKAAAGKAAAAAAPSSSPPPPAATSPAPAATNAAVAPVNVGTGFLDFAKNKKWAFSKEHGIPCLLSHNTHF